MNISVSGQAERSFAPNQVVAAARFIFQADTYDEALKGGVERVKSYTQAISAELDFTKDDFKTRAYSVHEEFNINKLEPTNLTDLDKNLEKRVSQGFFFNQYVELVFDYDKERLAKLLVFSSKLSDAPRLNINFGLKDEDRREKECLLIADAYQDAKAKVEVLTTAANKTLSDCIEVAIDGHIQRNYNDTYDRAMCSKAMNFESASEVEQQLQSIDETFKPDDIVIYKQISCVWKAE